MSFQLFIGGLGGPELVIIFFLVVLLFGANKLPKLARASGEAMGEFQKGREDIEREIRDAATVKSSDAETDVDAEFDGNVDDVELDRDAEIDEEFETDVDGSPSAA